MLKNSERLQAILVSLSASVIFLLLTSCGSTSSSLLPTKTSIASTIIPSEQFTQLGVTSGSPTIMTPKPTFLPTAVIPSKFEFTLESENIHICYEENQPISIVFIKVVNSGEKPLKSAYLQLYDETIGVELNAREAVNKPFIDYLHYCEWGEYDLQPGEYKYLSIGVPPLVAIKGREWRFTATICEEENLSGECASKYLLLTVP